jgi:hypothetical protein
MADKGWIGKKDKLPRRSPRRRGKICGRPFKAPRPVSGIEKDYNDSQVQLICTCCFVVETKTSGQSDIAADSRL